MEIVRHPELAADIREVAEHYDRISDTVISRFWREVESVIASVCKNPRLYHYDSSGLRRANLRKFPYHLLFEASDTHIFLVVFRHDRRDPEYGIERISQ